MPIKTLNGMFGEPKKTCKRNFIKENVRSVNHLQSFIRIGGTYRSRTSSDLFASKFDPQKSNEVINNGSRQNLKSNFTKKKAQSNLSTKQTFSERSVQTLENEFENLNVIVPKLKLDKKSLEEDIEPLSLEDEDSNVTQNKRDSLKNSDPINYKCETKENNCTDPFCPPGHVLLPEIERKQTLKTLKQKYDQLINELNSLSLRSDTLRIQKKKIEIENDLKKIDAGIRTFDRTRVYIKSY